MAAIVTNGTLIQEMIGGTTWHGPRRVAFADETDLGTPNTSLVFDTRGVSMMAVQAVFANYTSVTVKAQRSLDGTNYSDITNATTDTSPGVFSFDPQAPFVRLSIAGTLSASADTMSVWVYMERMR